MRTENGLVVGSNGKYQMRNPIGQFLLSRFDRAVGISILETKANTLLEIGCGEGHVTGLILQTGVSRVLATDISISLIKENTENIRDSRVSFQVADVMQFAPEERFDVVVCCEVLEHLKDPERGLKNLYGLGAREYIFSVPREPLFRCLNMCRGAYVSDFGNSPGHLNHWSKHSFLRFVEKYFTVQSVRTPLPWTVVRCQPR